MASKEAAFTAAMAKDGIDVRSVTLLAPSLSAILDDTPIETLESWKKTYGVTGVVLADRGWGYAIPRLSSGRRTTHVDRHFAGPSRHCDRQRIRVVPEHRERDPRRSRLTT
jgi:hypothetical protein